ncbi:MAG: hypothetical protein JOZ74_10145 [Bradyrhizobium sp.]|nr:hypothetical protein [Bradyrhizobium sp.]
MKKLVVLAITLLLAPAFSADASSARHRRHAGAAAPKTRPALPLPAAATPPVTRLPVAPDTFRA